MALSRTTRLLLPGNLKVTLTFVSVRDLSTPASTESKPIQLSKNLSFRPAHDSIIDAHKRPIVVVYGWLVAKSKHIHKYGDFYLGKGFDVLHVRVDPMQLLWPRRAQSVAGQIADFMTASERSRQPILVHGFSVGGYLYGETLIKLCDGPKRKAEVAERIRGQIFDSPVDYEGVPRGVGRAVTPVPILQKTIKFTLDSYLRLFYRPVTKYYIRSSQMFHSNPFRCPSLIFYSRGDPIGTPGPIEALMENWRKTGAPVYSKCWEDTPHVSHFIYHPVQYITALNEFLTSIGLQQQQSFSTGSQAAGETSKPKISATVTK